MTRHPIVTALIFALVVGSVARADDKPAEKPQQKKEIPRREVPDYAGRGSEPTTFGDKLLWVPRIILFPVYGILELGYRQPLVYLGRQAELGNLKGVVQSLFTFGEEDQYILYPSLLVDFGFRASFGLNFRAKNFPFKGHTLRIRAATGGTDYGIASISDDISLSKTGSIHIGAEIIKRPDFIFNSIGPMASKDTRYRYGALRKEGTIGYAETAFLTGSAELTLAIRDVSFYNGSCCGDSGIDQGIASGVFPAPSRYPDGYSAAAQRLHANWGGRVSRPENRTGGILDVTADHSFDLKGGGWWIYGGGITGYLDLTGTSRVVSIRLEGLNSNGEAGRTVPFNELPSIGGNLLPGFLARRFIGQSMIAATFEYKWPVLSLIDGVFHFGIGNVFGQGFDGLATRWLRKSIGFGIEGTGPQTSPFGLQIAFGSEPFAFGGAFNEFRFALRIGGT